jgi:hypothetical protein
LAKGMAENNNNNNNNNNIILGVKIFENSISNLYGVVHCDTFQKIVALIFFII